MPETVKMNVKLSLKDIKYFVFGEYYNRIKGTFIIYIVMVCILFVLVLLRSLRMIEWLLYTFYLIIPVCLLLGLSLLPSFARYMVLASTYKKDKNFLLTHTYEFSKYVITAATQTANHTYHWNYIFKVEEYRAGFLFYTAPNEYLIIPRRCFTSQEEHDLFYAIITSNLQQNKLDLKNHNPVMLSLDREPVTSPPDINPNSIIPDETPLAEISFKLTNAEFTAFYYRRVYTSPIGLFMVLIGLVFLIYGLVNSNILNLLLWSVIGASTLLASPVMLYFGTIKPLSNDPNIMKTVIYRFYTDYMISDGYADAKLRTNWNEINKISETKSSYIIYHQKTAHLIPKRAFTGKPQQLEIFLSLLPKAPQQK